MYCILISVYIFSSFFVKFTFRILERWAGSGRKVSSCRKVWHWPCNIPGWHVLKDSSVSNHWTRVCCPFAKNTPDFSISQRPILNFLVFIEMKFLCLADQCSMSGAISLLYFCPKLVQVSLCIMRLLKISWLLIDYTFSKIKQHFFVLKKKRQA